MNTTLSFKFNYPSQDVKECLAMQQEVIEALDSEELVGQVSYSQFRNQTTFEVIITGPYGDPFMFFEEFEDTMAWSAYDVKVTVERGECCCDCDDCCDEE